MRWMLDTGGTRPPMTPGQGLRCSNSVPRARWCPPWSTAREESGEKPDQVEPATTSSQEVVFMSAASCTASLDHFI